MLQGIARFPHHAITASTTTRDGQPKVLHLSGMTLRAYCQHAGIGEAPQITVFAQDGYAVAILWAESAQVYLAQEAPDGPYMLVLDEGHRQRWVKQVTQIIAE